jgi:hypothetical protein
VNTLKKSFETTSANAGISLAPKRCFCFGEPNGEAKNIRKPGQPQATPPKHKATNIV